MLGKDYRRQDCSIARALEVVGERWTLLIVRDAFYGVRRFDEIQRNTLGENVDMGFHLLVVCPDGYA